MLKDRQTIRHTHTHTYIVGTDSDEFHTYSKSHGSGRLCFLSNLR